MKIKNPCARPLFYVIAFKNLSRSIQTGWRLLAPVGEIGGRSPRLSLTDGLQFMCQKGYSAQCSVGRERKPLLKRRRSYVTPTSISRQFTRVQNHEMQNTFFVPLTDCCKAFFYFKIGAVPFLSWCTLSLTKEEEEGNFI